MDAARSTWSDVVPAYMQGRPQWVAWAPDPETDKDKVPFILGAPREKAKSNDPSTWRSFPEALKHYTQHAGPRTGVGYMLADEGLVFVDFDQCLDDAGQLKPWAAPLVRPFVGRTYIEVSPSGHGLHVFVRGKVGPAANGKTVKVGTGTKEQVEIYVKGRYSTITGNVYEGSDLLDEAQDAMGSLLRALHLEEKPQPRTGRRPAVVPPADVERARSALDAIDPDIEYPRWNKIGMALHSEWPEEGGPGFEAFNEWSSRGTKYQERRALERKWASFHPDKGISLGTLFYIAGECGWRAPATPRGPQATDQRAGGEDTPTAPDLFPLTDAGNAERYVARNGHVVRYVHGWKAWLRWDDSRWTKDECGQVRRLTVETARDLLASAYLVEDAKARARVVKHALGSERRDRIMAALDLAGSMDPVAVVPDELDRDANVLNVLNGEIDLPTGRLLPHDPAHLTTKLAPVAYDLGAVAPLWDKVLERVLPAPDVRSYLQRAIGYSLTGDVSEHALFFCYGTGANGKSTVLEVIREVLGEGEYAKAAQPDLLLAKKQERHAVELADLRGMRLVSTVEAGEGRSWDEVRVKWLTGGDTISARLMYGNPFSFSPTHKFWICANHKPRVAGTDLGFWRRVHLIPWTVTIPEAERDHDLRTKLRAELPGILRWAVEGAREWRRTGLRPPPAVLAATADYRSGEDVLGAFLEESTAPGGRVPSSALYSVYRAWADRNGERPATARAFGEAIEERGLERLRSHGKVWILGISLRNGEEVSGVD